MTINVEQKAKDVLATLYQIQPQINILGLDAEAEKLKEMRDDLRQLVDELSKDNRRLARVVGSCREDAMASYMELKQHTFSIMSGQLSDEEMQKVSIVAEVFVARSQEYLSCKTQFKALQNGGQ